MRRLVPQRRHPPPAEDDGARSGAPSAPQLAGAAPAARRPRRRYNLVRAALALPVVRPPHHAPWRTSRSLSYVVAARQVLRLRRRISAALPAGRAARRRAGAAYVAWRFGFDARRARRARCSSGAPSRSPSSTSTPVCCPTTSRCRCCGPGCCSTCGGTFVAAARGGDRRGRRLPRRCGSCTGASSSLTGKEGMGYGDFKMLAAIGAWLGWKMLPLVILLSSLVGLLFGAAQMFARARALGRDFRFHFGPYLADRRHRSRCSGATPIVALVPATSVLMTLRRRPHRRHRQRQERGRGRVRGARRRGGRHRRDRARADRARRRGDAGDRRAVRRGVRRADGALDRAAHARARCSPTRRRSRRSRRILHPMIREESQRRIAARERRPTSCTWCRCWSRSRGYRGPGRPRAGGRLPGGARRSRACARAAACPRTQVRAIMRSQAAARRAPGRGRRRDRQRRPIDALRDRSARCTQATSSWPRQA